MRRTSVATGYLLILLSVFAYSAYGFISPESAVYDPARGRYLVSDQGNGQIIAIDTTGHHSMFSSVLNVVKGLFIRHDTLFAAGGPGGLFCFDLETADPILEVDFPGQVDLNDVGADTSGNIYVSDPQGNQIFKLHLADLSTSVIVPSIIMPNGLLFDPPNNRMLVCQWVTNSPIQAINLTDYSLTVVADHGLDLLDGLTEDNAGNIYVSSFGTDAVHRYDHDFTRPPEEVSGGHADPGDIYYNKFLEILAVPNVSGQRVDFVYLPVGPVAVGTEFSDAAHGDGDGVPEAGETIELRLRFANTRPDSVIDLKARLIPDDASLVITDGMTACGDAASGDTVDNSADPFVFGIPDPYAPRTGTFMLEIIYRFRGETVIDTISLEQDIGKPRVLLLDDDDNEALEYYYMESLTRYRVPFRLRSSSPLPGVDDLLDYEVVIWFTGDYRADPLSADEITVIQDYLDAGRNLFLTGQGIAAQLDQTGQQDFLHTYLRCQYVLSALCPLANAAPGAQVFAEGDTLALNGSGGAGNQTMPDRITATNGAIPELDYVASSDQAAVSYHGAYRLFFAAFSFEAAANGNSRWLERNVALMKILTFLGCTLPVTPMTLTISPGDPQHLTDHAPEIAWEYGGAEFIQQMYHIRVGTDNDWSSAEMWDYGPVTGSGTSVIYAGADLADGAEFFFRVSVSDGTAWSNWYGGSFRMNWAPTAPTGLTPDNMNPVYTTTPLLTHDNAVDNDDEEFLYSYEIYDDSLLMSPVAQASEQPATAGATTSYMVTSVLPVGEDYFWRVRAGDAYEEGPWSAAASFFIVAYSCGDANGDSQPNVGDAVFLVNYVFKNGLSPDPVCAGDANGDGRTDIGDAVYLINFVFKNGPPPVATCCLST